MYKMSEELHMTIASSDHYVLPFINKGVFRMTTRKWPNWYVYMKDNSVYNVQGKEGYPGEQGEFKFTALNQSSGRYYLISSIHWPNRYIYMQKDIGGNVQGWEGDPGPQGHWRITPRPDRTILLSTEKWSNCYMYMQNWPSGDVQGTADLNEQAHFILSCDIQLKGDHVDGHIHV